jgi:hypothetical protein
VPTCWRRLAEWAGAGVFDQLHLEVLDRLGLTAAVTAANVNDTSLFEAVLDDVPAVRTPAGRRRTRPGMVHADKTSHAVRGQVLGWLWLPLRWANAACSW